MEFLTLDDKRLGGLVLPLVSERRLILDQFAEVLRFLIKYLLEAILDLSQLDVHYLIELLNGLSEPTPVD